MWDDGNTFLNGPFEPWHQEADTFDLEVVGELPRELNGVLYRGSANQRLRPPEPSRHHWFEGNGMIFGVFLRAGRAHSSNRWVQPASFRLEKERGGTSPYGSYMNGGVLPDPSLVPPSKNGANTNVMLFDDRLLVFQETDLPQDLHPTTLETRGEYDFHGEVTGAVTAHWKIDPRNGDLLFYGVSGLTITWYHADAHGKLLSRFAFDMGHPSVMHDFAVTEDYAVFQISPMITSVPNLMAGLPGMVWDPQNASGSRFAVLDRHTGAVRWFEGEGDFAITHYYNSYQDGDRIVVDGHRTGRWGWTPEQVEAIEPGQDFNEWFRKIEATPWRWELDLVTGRTTEHQTTDVRGEYPRINDAYQLSKHRYGYFTTIQSDDFSLTDGLAKYDYQADRTQLIPAGELVSPSEAVFVPRGSAAGEDDGWLLSLWWNPANRLTELLVHDALHFDAEPIARVKLLQRVPAGFHGNWVDGAVVEAALAAQPA